MAGPIAGRAVRIKYDADGAGGTAAVEIARGRTEDFSINNEPIDATSKGDGNTALLLGTVGTKSYTMSFSGVMSDEHKALVGIFADADVDNATIQLEFDMPSLGVFAGLWFVESCKLGGAYGNDVATIEMSFRSSGAITWTPAS